MNSLKRNRLLSNAVIVNGCVPINAALSHEVQFLEWLDKLTSRNCKRHGRTPLVLDREKSRSRSLSENCMELWYRRYNDPHFHGEIPKGADLDKFYPFDAIFHCPACRCAYALCPPEFHETSFETFDTSTPERLATFASAREFAAQVNKHGCGFALFVGPPGPGKTRLACNIIRVLEHRDSLYVRQGELTCALRATYGRKDVILHRSQRSYDNDAVDDNPPTPLEIVQKMRFLVLDEICSTALANDEQLLLDELLKHRYEQRKPTILISNLPLTGTPDAPGLKEFLGDALSDRIREATGNGKYIVQFSGESYRRTTGENYLQALT
jgi:DNA replication protein DnaC